MVDIDTNMFKHVSTLFTTAGFSTTGLISALPKALDPNCPKLVFRYQTPNVRVLGSENLFM